MSSFAETMVGYLPDFIAVGMILGAVTFTILWGVAFLIRLFRAM